LKFTRTTLSRLSVMMPTAFIVIALIMASCTVLGVLLSELTGVSRLDGYLATTPGGLPAVLAATTSTGGDITFVSTVQLLRIIIVLVTMPFLARWLFGMPQEEN
jgi:membrane AbrB-like protein